MQIPSTLKAQSQLKPHDTELKPLQTLNDAMLKPLNDAERLNDSMLKPLNYSEIMNETELNYSEIMNDAELNYADMLVVALQSTAYGVSFYAEKRFIVENWNLRLRVHWN